jgi:putative acetyltransferase
MTETIAFAVRRLDADEALARRVRLQAIFRDAVRAAGPVHYTPAQVAAWSSSADDDARWQPWLADGTTWAAEGEEGDVVGFATTWPDDYLHLLYVDPAFHRRGVARALLCAVDEHARARGIAALTADASLISHPVFAAHAWAVVAWEDVERMGQVFRRARMRKALR